LIYRLGPELGTLNSKITKWHFYSASKEGTWLKKKSNSMQLKSDILAILQKGLEWPCLDSLGLQKVSEKIFL
jgi:hypothetical protein